MITVLNKNDSSKKGNSSYNLNILNPYLARKNFVNSISAVSTPTHTLTNFNTFMGVIYSNNLQDNLSLWFSSQYTERSGSIVSNLQDVDKIFFYSKNKDYSGEYFSYLINKSKFDSTDNSLRFTTTESLYYHLTLDKVLPLGNSDKTIIIVMSPLNSVYEYDNTENNWFFNYGLDWTNSLEPSSEGLCFTYDDLLSNGKKISYDIGGNNNILVSDNTDIQSKGVIRINYSNSNKLITRSFKNVQTPNMDADLDINYPINIKSGNGFFINSHILNNSVFLTTQAFHRMKNWKLYEFMIFDKDIPDLVYSSIYSYLKNKYSISDYVSP
jgi:hypothetical protein